MKKNMIIILVMCVSLIACGAPVPDYQDCTMFETDLNNGADMVGKTVCIDVTAIVPDSAFGYNLQAGKHLNFCSEKIPDQEVTVGQTLTVKVTAVSIVAGSYIIRYRRL